MKILQISSRINTGSVGRIAGHIGEKVIDNNGLSFIVYARNNLPSKSTVIKIGTKLDIYKHVLQTRLFDNHSFSSKNATKKLIDHITKINPDIIHLHNLHGYYINIDILFKYLKTRKRPVIWTLHDCWPFTGRCAHFEFVNCEKWKTECYNCPQLHEYPKALFFDKSSFNYNRKKEIFNGVENLTIVPVSYWLGNLVKESFLKDYPIRVIQNGIDIDVFKPNVLSYKTRSKYNITKPFMILGVASNWNGRKGLKYFIELNDMLPSDAIIVLVGISQKQRNALPSSMVGILRTENLAELANLYSAADVFVNPTLEDTFPTTNLEALACGTPVITFETGGSVESVCDDTGFVVPKTDVGALCRKVVIIKDKGKAVYSENCRRKAEELYDRNKKFNEYINLYKTLLNIC